MDRYSSEMSTSGTQPDQMLKHISRMFYPIFLPIIDACHRVSQVNYNISG